MSRWSTWSRLVSLTLVSPMRVSPHRLATLLARRLNDVVPAPFRLDAKNGLLHLYIEDEWDTTSFTLDIVEDETREFAERLESAVASILSSIQDSISEHLRTPWPSADGRAMAVPGVGSDTKSIHLWYGDDERSAIVSIPAIQIAEIMDGENLASVLDRP